MEVVLIERLLSEVSPYRVNMQILNLLRHYGLHFLNNRANQASVLFFIVLAGCGPQLRNRSEYVIAAANNHWRRDLESILRPTNVVYCDDRVCIGGTADRFHHECYDDTVQSSRCSARIHECSLILQHWINYGHSLLQRRFRACHLTPDSKSLSFSSLDFLRPRMPLWICWTRRTWQIIRRCMKASIQ